MHGHRVEVHLQADGYHWELLRLDGIVLDWRGPFRRLDQAADHARATYGPTTPVTMRASQRKEPACSSPSPSPRSPA
jgi:hypothetical protein